MVEEKIENPSIRLKKLASGFGPFDNFRKAYLEEANCVDGAPTDYHTIHDWYYGKHFPSEKALPLIAKVLDVSVDELRWGYNPTTAMLDILNKFIVAYDNEKACEFYRRQGIFAICLFLFLWVFVTVCQDALLSASVFIACPL